MAEGNTSGIISIVAVVAIILVLGVLSFFKWQERRTVTREIKIAEQDITRMSQQLEEKKELERRIQEAMKAVAELTEILPNKAEIEEANFLRLLRSFQEKSRVKLDTLNPLRRIGGEPAAEKGYRQHKYEIKLTGTYPQFVKFLHLLETHRRYFKVDSFELKLPTQKEVAAGESPNLSIKMKVSTYTYEYKGT